MIPTPPPQWLKELTQHLAGQGDVVPKGWYPATQYAMWWGVSRTMTALKLSVLLRKGLMESGYYKVPNRNGHLRRVAHYAPVGGMPPGIKRGKRSPRQKEIIYNSPL